MGWLSGYNYRKSVTLSRASGAVSNYQMKLLVGESSGATGEDVDCGGLCLSTFNDLRFTTSDGATLLDYWIESVTGTTPNQLATVWIEFDSIGTTATTFYMYYGKADASSVSNGANTFLFFDDFDDNSLDTDKWEVLLNTWQETGGLLKGTCGDTAYSVIISKNQVAPTDNYAVDATIAAQYGLNTGNYQSGLVINDAKTTATIGLGYWVDLTGYDEWIVQDESGALTEGTKDTGFDARNTNLYSFRKNGTAHKLFVNDAEKVSHTYSWGTAPQYVGCFVAYATNYANFNNFRVRNYLITEPAWGAWGTQQGSIFTEETLTLTDTSIGIFPYEITSESLTLTDDSSYLHLLGSTSESLTITDIASNGIIITGVTAELATITDVSENIVMVEPVTDALTITDIAESDELIRKIRKIVKFPNLQGKHLSLKFESATDGSFAVYYLRHKMFKTRELTSDQKHPNTQGSHIGIKLSNSGSDEFILMYSSQEHYMVDT